MVDVRNKARMWIKTHLTYTIEDIENVGDALCHARAIIENPDPIDAYEAGYSEAIKDMEKLGEKK